MSRLRLSIIIALALLPALSGCDLFPDPAADALKQEAEAAAVGAGCRQSGRSIEQCLLRNESLSPKAGVLKGWRDMDDYMRSNKIEPQVPPPEPKSAPKKKEDEEEPVSASSANGADEATEPVKEGAEPEGATDGSATKGLYD